MSESNATRESERPHRAGAFDIRNFIGLLIGIYGIVLVLLGIFHNTTEELARADNLNLNLWAGIGMIVGAACFLVWARLRPVIVPTPAEQAKAEDDGEPPAPN
jgi:hypothetical protein